MEDIAGLITTSNLQEHTSEGGEAALVSFQDMDLLFVKWAEGQKKPGPTFIPNVPPELDLVLGEGAGGLAIEYLGQDPESSEGKGRKG